MEHRDHDVTLFASDDWETDVLPRCSQLVGSAVRSSMLVCVRLGGLVNKRGGRLMLATPLLGQYENWKWSDGSMKITQGGNLAVAGNFGGS